MAAPADRGPPRRSTRGPGLLIGRPFGVPVYLSGSWFLFAAFITFAYAPQIAELVPGIGDGRYLVAAAFALLLAASVLVHELAHCAVSAGLGLPVKRVTLFLLGGVSEIEREPETPAREYLVAVAGPMVSLLLAGVGAALVPVLPRGSVPRALAVLLAIANGAVAVFNALPGLPLDGGRVLRAAVWGTSGSKRSGSVAGAWSGRVLAVLLVVATVAPLVFGEGSSTLSFGVLLSLVLAAFIWAGASQSLQVAQLQDRLPTVQARALARRALPVPADLPLSEAVRRAGEAGARGLVVVDREGQPQALVAEAAVIATPAHRRPWVTVGTLSRGLTDGLVLDADLSGRPLLEALQRTSGTEYLVVERDGRILGVLASADVTAAISGSPAPATAGASSR